MAIVSIGAVETIAKLVIVMACVGFFIWGVDRLLPLEISSYPVGQFYSDLQGMTPFFEYVLGLMSFVIDWDMIIKVFQVFYYLLMVMIDIKILIAVANIPNKIGFHN